MANLAWAVERVIESPIDRPLNRFEAYLEQQRHRELETEEETSSAPKALRYRLSTELPNYWIPLMPVRIGEGLRLKRGDVLKTDGARGFVQALGRVLESKSGTFALRRGTAPRRHPRHAEFSAHALD